MPKHSTTLDKLRHKVSSNKQYLGGLDYVLIFSVFGACFLLVTIIATYYMATQTRLSEYKTPIPLTEREFARGQMVQGYFDGRKIYNGKVIITRQMTCNDGFTKTLPDLDSNKSYFESIQPARAMDGQDPRSIAKVPEEARVGSNCFIAFNHTACIQYLFGCYDAEYSYVSLPFVVSGSEIMNQPTESTEQTIPDDQKGLTSPVINDTPSEQSQSQPQAIAATPAPEGPGQDLFPTPSPTAEISTEGEDSVLQGLLRSVNDTVYSIFARPIRDLL